MTISIPGNPLASSSQTFSSKARIRSGDTPGGDTGAPEIKTKLTASAEVTDAVKLSLSASSISPELKPEEAKSYSNFRSRQAESSDQEEDKVIGDIDGDGLVNERDFKILVNNLFQEGGEEDGDLNGDGFVDGQDFIIFNENKNINSDDSDGPATTPVFSEVEPQVIEPPADNGPRKVQASSLSAEEVLTANAQKLSES